MRPYINVLTDDENIFQQLETAAVPPFTVVHNQPVDLKDMFIVTDMVSYQQKKDLLDQVTPQNLFVLSSDTDENNMNSINQNKLRHLVGLNENIYGSEIIQHIKRFYEKHIWGLESHLDQNAEIKIISLSDSRNTNEMIQEALENFNFDEYFSSPTEYLKVMANELISNSLYKGPNRRRMEQGLDGADRKSPVFLKGADLVLVTLGMDSKGVALSVQDSFGGLSYDTLISSLNRSFSEKTVMDKKDGAGLGLYLTFLHSNHFIVNYRENFRTEVICIIEKNRRYKNYKQRIRSFHFCEEVTSEKISH